MDDVPWPLVVMVFIGFLGWLKNRIQEAAEFRRERAEARRLEKEGLPPTYQTESPSETHRAEPEKEKRVPSSLKDLMAQMEAHEEEQRRQSEREEQEWEERLRREALAEARSSTSRSSAPLPPPLPDKTTEIELADVGATVKLAKDSSVGKLGKIAKVALPARPPSNAAADSYYSSRKQRSAAVKTVVKSFRDRRNIQSAIILKEILDTPKGLQ